MLFRRAIALAFVALAATGVVTAFAWNTARADSTPIRDDLSGEPVPKHLLDHLPDYVQQSSPRLVTYPNGNQEITFDKVAAKRDYRGELPFCEPRDPSAPRRRMTQADLDRVAREGGSCLAMVDRIMVGPPSGAGPVGPGLPGHAAADSD